MMFLLCLLLGIVWLCAGFTTAATAGMAALLIGGPFWLGWSLVMGMRR